MGNYPEPTEDSKTDLATTETSVVKPPRFKLLVWTAPLLLYIILVSFLSRLMHWCNDRHLISTTLALTIFVVCLSLFYLVMLRLSRWCRTRAIHILLAWCLLPVICQQLGISHALLFKVFGDSWLDKWGSL